MWRLAFALLLIPLIACGGPEIAPDSRQENELGLQLASPDELRGVPLAATPYSGEELPPSVDLSPDLPPPGQQGKQKSCVAWAIAYALKSYQEHVEEKIPIVRDGRIDPSRVFSPAFIYNQINNGRDGGSFYRDALNLLSGQGAAPWSEMPYDANDYNRAPSERARAVAKRYRIDYWRQVNAADTKEVKAHVAAGYPVLIGAKTDEGFLRAGHDYVWRSTIGEQKGGHAMLVCGYDDGRRAFKVINSWGTQWGDGGFGWIDYDHFRNVVNEAYVVKDALNNRPDNTKVDPTQPVTSGIEFKITNVEHNTSFPDHPELGYFMRFDGSLEIPGGMGKTDMIVVYFFFDAGGGKKGDPVRSLQAHYTTTDGFTACGTQRYPIPPEGLRTTWGTWLPYATLDLTPGTWVDTPSGREYQPREHHLLAEPMVFVDNFGVRTGGLVSFIVRR